MPVLFSEHRGTFSKAKFFVTKGYDDGSEKLEILEKQEMAKQSASLRQSSWLLWILMTFRQIFLPHGFPESVSNDYVEYQVYDTIQAFSSSITGALATEAVMRGVGVGQSEATPLAAAMTWLLKQGSGMVGQIMFTWSKGTSLDYDNKKWRLFADCLNDSAIFLDLLLPLFPPSLTVFVLCISSVARALVGVSGGATRAAIIQHQARRNNSADVSAKDGSQETLVNLVSLLVSLVLLPLVSGRQSIVWTFFLFFTFLHLYANYCALRALKLETFNRSRLLIALKHFLDKESIPTISATNQSESLIIGFGIKDKDICGFSVTMGVSMESALQPPSLRNIQTLLTMYQEKDFIIIPNADENRIRVILGEHCQPLQLIEAYARSIITARYMHGKPGVDINPLGLEVSETWDAFRQGVLDRGFNLSSVLIQTQDWRSKWKNV